MLFYIDIYISKCAWLLCKDISSYLLNREQIVKVSRCSVSCFDDRCCTWACPTLVSSRDFASTLRRTNGMSSWSRELPTLIWPLSGSRSKTWSSSPDLMLYLTPATQKNVRCCCDVYNGHEWTGRGGQLLALQRRSSRGAWRKLRIKEKRIKSQVRAELCVTPATLTHSFERLRSKLRLAQRKQTV